MKLAILTRDEVPSQAAYGVINNLESSHNVVRFTFSTLSGFHAETDVSPFNAVIGIGGDGTVLAAARFAAQYQLPVAGISDGHVGFLADFSTGNLGNDIIAALQAGEIEDRTAISYGVRSSIEPPLYRTAINEVAIKAMGGKLISYRVTVDDMLAYEVKADGLLISTPMGSTAYALAAGGPVISPTTPVLELVPLLPQTLSYRPLIVNKRSKIGVSLQDLNDHVTVFGDGQETLALPPRSGLQVNLMALNVMFVKSATSNYFDALRTKLNWHAAPGRGS